MERRRALLVLSGGAFFGLRASFGFAAPVPNDPLVVVVAENSGIQKLSWSQIRGIYLGDSIKDAGGSRVIAINQLPNTPDRVAFDRKALNMSPDEVGRFWIDRRLRGQGAPPRSFASPVLLQRLIQKIPGAMTYVRLSQIIPGVRIVPIDDKKPGDAGYLLS